MSRLSLTSLLFLLALSPASAQRPEPSARCFTSPAIEQVIARMQPQLEAQDTLLWRMFQQCFPNTLDTTVRFEADAQGNPTGEDTFVVTGDIAAMWLRDSGAQVWPYVRYVNQDESLRLLIRGVIERQLSCLLIDPYANAFNAGPTGSPWESDYTDMKPELHERKYELDSQCYPIRLAYEYWKQSGDTSVFDDRWLDALRLVLKTMREQQRRNGPRTSYNFQRTTHALHDTMSNWGYGHPAHSCGLIAQAFRPSDDSTVFPFNIPGNFFAVSVLHKAAEIVRKVNKDKALANECEALAHEVEEALQQQAIVQHPVFGPVYAFEVDGSGSHLLMDDANAPSLLSLPYLTDMPADDPIYLNTRRMILSDYNPYYFSGSAGQGIGSPHTGYDYVWPMSIIMQALTSTSPEEQQQCIAQLKATHAGTGFMHEAFKSYDASQFTRSWFAWANTLFGELVLKLYE